MLWRHDLGGNGGGHNRGRGVHAVDRGARPVREFAAVFRAVGLLPKYRARERLANLVANPISGEKLAAWDIVTVGLGPFVAATPVPAQRGRPVVETAGRALALNLPPVQAGTLHAPAVAAVVASLSDVANPTAVSAAANIIRELGLHDNGLQVRGDTRMCTAYAWHRHE